MEKTQIAKIAHEANRALCIAFGDNSQPVWENAPDWQVQSALDGVDFHLSNPDAPPSYSHDNWYKFKEADGWTYGTVKNPDLKQHPCMVPFSELSPQDKAKDYVFSAIVRAAAE